MWILLGSERSAGGLLGGEGDPKERGIPRKGDSLS